MSDFSISSLLAPEKLICAFSSGLKNRCFEAIVFTHQAPTINITHHKILFMSIVPFRRKNEVSAS
jgi:hypothetical protein